MTRETPSSRSRPWRTAGGELPEDDTLTGVRAELAAGLLELADQDALAAALIEHLPVAVLIAEANGGTLPILIANAAARRSLGGEPVGHPTCDFIPDDDLKPHRDGVAACRARGGNVSEEYETPAVRVVNCLDGRRRPMKMATFYFRGAVTERYIWIGTAPDVRWPGESA